LGSGIIRVAFCCMCAVLCAWVIASSKVVRRPWTGIWYTSLFATTRGTSNSTLTLCVMMFVCWFVCLLSPSIQLCCLSVAARRIQVRKIGDEAHTSLKALHHPTHTLIRLSHCALLPSCICRFTVCVCVYTPPGIEPSGGLGV
jgi:uncharacterized membrane protein